ncbi:MAG: hypothetical protein U1F65_11640 [Verrucomicrobiota bacterium]
MIQFFTTHAHRYTIEGFLAAWAAECRDVVNVHSYERFPLSGKPAAGVWVFSDMERLHRAERRFAENLADSLRALPGHGLILNDPRRYRGRFELLHDLHQQGLNHFRAWRLAEVGAELKFPVFLRSELEHTVISPLLHSPEQLRAALRRHRRRRDRGHLLVVEFCDCRDADGLIRKYSAMNIHGRLFPRHIFFSRDWMVKGADLVGPEQLEEESRFMDGFPHAELVADAFRLCGLDYGRIDYSFHRGQIQVWEINSNPMIVPRAETLAPGRLPAQTRSAQAISAALRELAGRVPATPLPFYARPYLRMRVSQLFGRILHERRS